MLNFKKVTSVLLIFCILCSVLSFGAYAEKSGTCWYLKRNGNKQPIFSKSQSEVIKNGGYYLDTSLSDNSEEKRIYLTFDFGYENGNVERIANTLKEYNVPAAFFVLDNPIIKNTELICRLAEDGHLICNHTKNHRDLTQATNDEIASNLKALEKIYEQKTGKQLAKYFRFPEGKYSEEAMKVINDLGYKTVFWSFAYDDWDNSRQPDREKAVKKVLENTHNGAVMLFHPTSTVNADIFPTLIREWKSMGYSFGTLDELVVNVNKR